MPRIEEISIRIGPGKNEDIPSITLRRTNDKQWEVIDENGFNRGLYAGEVRLANRIQEEIISKFNTNSSD